MSEKRVQYEFKLIVTVGEEAWPDELRARIEELVQDEELWLSDSSKTLIDVRSIERVRDY